MRKKNNVDTKIDRLTTIVRRSFDSLETRMDKGFATVAEDIADIQDTMATKGDIDGITKTLDDHTRQLDNIHTDIKTIRDKRMQLEVRVDHVEKHLGIKAPAGTTSR